MKFLIVAAVISMAGVQCSNSKAADNFVNIDQIGSNNTVGIQQNGINSVGGVGQQAMPIQGQGNIVKIRQGDPINAFGSSSIEAAVYGDYNYLGLNQGTTLNNQTNGQDTGQHYQFSYSIRYRQSS